MDPEYAFYSHFENLKNSLYRELSGARKTHIFWPKFYYSWFYAEEKTLYNILNLRQKLGTEIKNDEIVAYNALREQIIPISPFRFKTKSVSARLDDGTKVKYDDVTWKRKDRVKLLFGSLAIALIAIFRYKLSYNWIAGSFAPFALLSYMDRKYVPYSEIENFYKFLYEKRKADTIFKVDNGAINKQLEAFDKSTLDKIKRELELSNRTLYEVAQDLDEIYLRAAANSEKVDIDLNKI